MEDTLAKAEALATKFEKKTRYFLDAFFQSGAHMVNRQEVVNPYNAFKAQKAAEHRERAYYPVPRLITLTTHQMARQ
jgi:hypothetical protein